MGALCLSHTRVEVGQQPLCDCQGEKNLWLPGECTESFCICEQIASSYSNQPVTQR